jgi:hypothetical protein
MPLGTLARINFLAINESFLGTEPDYLVAIDGARAELFMEFSKTDWDTSTEAGKLAEEIVNHLTAADLIKNKPLKREHAIFLTEEAHRKIKKIRANPLFGHGNTSTPVTVVMGKREFQTRGMNPLKSWYNSLKVNNESDNTGSQWLAS